MKKNETYLVMIKHEVDLGDLILAKVIFTKNKDVHLEDLWVKGKDYNEFFDDWIYNDSVKIIGKCPNRINGTVNMLNYFKNKFPEYFI